MTSNTQQVNNNSVRGVSFEDALVATKFGKFNYICILVCGFLFMSWFYEIMGFGYYLPVAECDLGITNKLDYAIINGFAYAGLVVSYYLWGLVGDTKGRKKVLIPTITMSLLFSVISSFTYSFWIFAILRFLNGFFVSTTSNITFSYMAEFHSSKYRSQAIMMSSSIYGAIGILLPFMGWVIINLDWTIYIPFLDIVYKPWRLYVLYCSLPSFISLMSLIWMPESPKFIYNTGDETETIKILQKVYTMNTGRTDYPVTKIVDPEFGVIRNTSASQYCTLMWKSTGKLFGKSYLRVTSILCYLQFGAVSFNMAMLLFFPKILHDTAVFTELRPGDHSHTICGIEEFLAANLQNVTVSVATELHQNLTCIDKMSFEVFGFPMITEITYTVGFFLIGILLKYFSIWTLSNSIFLLCFAGSVGLTFCSIPLLSNLLFVILLLSGLNSNMIGSATVDLYPTNLRSSALGISLISGRLGSIIGSNVVGSLFDYYCDLIFPLNAIIFISCTIVPFFLPKPKPVDPIDNEKF